MFGLLLPDLSQFLMLRKSKNKKKDANMDLWERHTQPH